MNASRRRLGCASLLAACGAFAGRPARAQSLAASNAPPELAGDLPGAQLQGAGALRFLGFRVYDARLWHGARPLTPATAWDALPFALEIEYARALVGVQIAERSLVEMRRQGAIAAGDAERWLALMTDLFPDVKVGDRITALHLPGAGARFFVNGRLRGEPRETEFARRFFGIWLAPQTSQPQLRVALLGSARP